ncbi:27 kDa hemolymph protein [Gryllus bimaculatus]|nr:27 kDa hemolymph protein [Gryllus bimaculatus]
MLKMKVLFISFIFAGIVHGNIGSGHTTNQLNTEFNSEELIDDQVIIKCVNNGDDEVYQKAKYARQKLTTCGTSLLHTDKVLPEVRAAVIGGGKGMGPIIKKVCKSYQTSGHLCLSRYLNDLKPCLNESQTRLEELVVKMSETSWEYACQKEGLRAQMFFKNSTISCFEETSPGILHCVAPYLPLLRAAGDPTRAVAQILVNKECSVFLTVANCIVNEMNKCDDKTAANLVAGSFNETLRISPCEEFVGSISGEHKKPTSLQTLVDAQSLQMVLINKLDELVKNINEEREESRQHEIHTQQTLNSLIENQSNLLQKLYLLLEESASRSQRH